MGEALIGRFLTVSYYPEHLKVQGTVYDAHGSKTCIHGPCDLPVLYEHGDGVGAYVRYYHVLPAGFKVGVVAYAHLFRACMVGVGRPEPLIKAWCVAVKAR